jgi:hypothetical protein
MAEPIPVTGHHLYALLWELAEELRKQEHRSSEGCWLAIMNAFWDGELPGLYVFVKRRGAVPGRELMPLPSRDVLAGHLLGRIRQVNDESAGVFELSEWIAELHGWTLEDYQGMPEPFCTFAAHDVTFGFAVPRADFEQWRAKPLKEKEETLTPQPSTLSKDKTKSRRGPKPGELRRYDTADRALLPELEQIMAAGKMSPSAAALVLAEDRKIAGVGTPKSRAKRLVELYSRTKNKSP